MGNNAASPRLLKKINRSLIIEKIKRDGPISRAQIAKALSLSKTTVGSIVDEMLSKRLVVESGISNSTSMGGRPSAMLSYNSRSAYCVGMDVGGTKILLTITDLLGEIVFERKVASVNELDALVAMTQKAIADAGLQESDIIGMGVGVPGSVSGCGIVIQAKSMNWTNYNLQKNMREFFSFPVYVFNDVNCAAEGERWLGSGVGANDMFFVAIGTGVGAAIISGGSIVEGSTSRSGEVCYWLSPEDVAQGRLNQFGKSGVFEKKVSGTALSAHGIDARQLFADYSRGAGQHRQIVDTFVRDLSVMIANVVSLLNPTCVVIGGGVSESMSCVISQINSMVGYLTPIRTDVRLASLGGKAGALGAVACMMERLEDYET